MEDKRIYFLDHLPENVPSCIRATGMCYTWRGTLKALELGFPVIYTTQMGLMSMRLIEEGYRIFIFDEDAQDISEAYEIKEGKCERTNRELRLAHNIFKMWGAGEFAK